MGQVLLATYTYRCLLQAGH